MKGMHGLLEKMLARNKIQLAARKKEFPLHGLIKALKKKEVLNRDFGKAIRQQGRLALIAEIKRASPSLGCLRKNFEHIGIAKEFELGGADALSVVTESAFFRGELSFLDGVRKVTKSPLMRKDFIFEPYQLYESKLHGADAVLLIAGMLRKKRLIELMGLAKALELDCMVETRSREEIKAALDCGAEIIGINNRNLRTFEVDLDNFCRLSEFVPKNKTLVCESGINTKKDVLKVKNAGADAVLIGTSLMRSDNIQKKIRELLG